ncbi:MAG: nitric oxide synthase [Deltaproteobacteria bacterium]|nr:nitric oxide synthase [Deltaproteobacteria bacterium]
MANSIAEGIRFWANNAVLKKISEGGEKDLAGNDGYVFGCPTYHREHDCGDEDMPFSGREGKSLLGKMDGRFGSYTHGGESAPMIFDTMLHVFQNGHGRPWLAEPERSFHRNSRRRCGRAKTYGKAVGGKFS